MPLMDTTGTLDWGTISKSATLASRVETFKHFWPDIEDLSLQKVFMDATIQYLLKHPDSTNPAGNKIGLFIIAFFIGILLNLSSELAINKALLKNFRGSILSARHADHLFFQLWIDGQGWTDQSPPGPTFRLQGMTPVEIKTVVADLLKNGKFIHDFNKVSCLPPCSFILF